MATIVSSSIGSVDPGTEAFHYSTIALWEDATDVDLRAGTGTDEQHDGKLINETFSSAGTVATIAGATPDATHYRRLTCMPGASFRDNANVQTNALRANASNGAFVTSSANAETLSGGETFFRMEGLQLENTHATGTSARAYRDTAGSPTIDFCIFSVVSTGTTGAISTSTGTYRNSLIEIRGSGATSALLCGNFATIACTNLTIVAPADLAAAPAQAITTAANGTVTFKNCGFFGFAALKSGTVNPTYTTCHDDLASPPTGVTQVTYANQFENVNAATRDFRLKTGADMIDSGTTDATNAPIDIAGTARPEGAAYDTGCWELVAAAGTTLSLDSGAVLYAGQTLKANLAIAIDSGAASYTGQALTLNAETVLELATAAIAYVGQALTINAETILALAAGAVSYAGKSLGGIGALLDRIVRPIVRNIVRNIVRGLTEPGR